MAELQFVLTPEEHQYLAELLEAKLKDVRIEEHRTRAPSYRQHIIRQEELMLAILNKLQQVPTSP